MYQIIILIITAIIISFIIILYLVENQKYKVNEGSIIEKKAKELYVKEYPNTDIKDLERQIRIVAERFVDFKDSNRYTGRLVQKAKGDYKVKKIKKLLLDDIKIINYHNKSLKARVRFKDLNSEYFFIMKMKTVYSGRIFLRSYKILKNNIKNKERIV